MLKRFAVLLSAAIAMTGLAGPAPAMAQAYPSGPIKMIVPFGPGSGTDIFARMIGDELKAQLNATVVIENRPGANGVIAATAAARAPADGYTLLFTTNATHSIAPASIKDLPYDAVKDFEPVALFAEAVFVLVVRKDFPANDYAEFIEWLQKNKDKSTYGVGNATGQIGTMEFLKRTGTEANGVPYRSTQQAIMDILGKQIDFMIMDMPGAQAHLQGGTVKAIAVTVPKRSVLLPNVATVAENGLKGYDISSWLGMFAPAGTPPAIIEALNQAVVKMQARADIQEKVRGFGAEVRPLTPAQFKDYVVRLRDAWSEKVKYTGFVQQ